MTIYERVTLGESLWDDPAFLRTILHNSSEAMLTIDTESRILFATPAIEDLLGYDPEELVGSSKMTIIPERLRPVHQASLERHLETGERNIDWNGTELPALHAEGHEVPVSVSLRRHEYEGETLFTGIFRDISEVKRHEAELQARNDELEELAGMLSHDLRNPLGVAQGYTELARADTDDENLERVGRALDRMEEIIQDMLARARADESAHVDSEQLQLGPVMEAAWESILTPYAKLEVVDPDWRFRGRRGRTKQLAENLFRNAVEHGREDVTVRVGTLDDADGFYVEDDGPGLPNSLKGRTWLPEGRSTDTRRSYGLRIVEAIASEHGWELYLTDAADGGARFEFHQRPTA